MGQYQSTFHKNNLVKLKYGTIAIDKLLPWLNSLPSQIINNASLIDDYHINHGFIHWIYSSNLSNDDKYIAIIICIIKEANPFKIPYIVNKNDKITADVYFCNRSYKLENKDLDKKLYDFIIKYFSNNNNNSVNDNLLNLSKSDESITNFELFERYNLFVNGWNPDTHDYSNSK